MDGRRLKELRKKHGITQKELADFLHITAKAISFYELGEREPSNGDLIKMADYFEVSTDYLLGHHDKKTSEGKSWEAPAQVDGDHVVSQITSFGAVLKSLRKYKKITQAELAHATRLTVSAISMYENGNREPNFKTLELLSDYFQVDMNILLGTAPIEGVTHSRSMSCNSTGFHGFPKRVQQLRKAKGLSQMALASMVHLTQQAVASWEKGISSPPLDVLLNLSRIFGVSTDYLLGNTVPLTTLGNFGRLQIKDTRLARGLTQAEVAQQIHVTDAAYSRYENGLLDIPNGILLKLSDIFDVPIDYLLGNSADGSGRVPICKRLSAGISMDDAANIAGWLEVPEKMVQDGNYFACYIGDGTMEPRMGAGDILIVRRQEDVENGKVAVVQIGDNEVTVKQVWKTNSGLSLIAYNPAEYKPHFYESREVQSLPVRIIGQVVEFRAKL